MDPGSARRHHGAGGATTPTLRPSRRTGGERDERGAARDPRADGACGGSLIQEVVAALAARRSGGLREGSMEQSRPKLRMLERLVIGMLLFLAALLLGIQVAKADAPAASDRVAASATQG